MNTHIERLHVFNDIKDDDLVGRGSDEIRRFALHIRNSGIKQPILVTPYRGKYKVLDGRKRVLAARLLVEEFSKPHFKRIDAVITETNGPHERLLTAILSNEKRSVSKRQLYQWLTELRERQELKNAIKWHRINKQTVESVMVLDKLQHKEKFFEYADEGMVAEGTLLALAKEDKDLHDVALSILENEERFTRSELRDLTSVQREKVMSKLSGLDIPKADPQDYAGKFVFLPHDSDMPSRVCSFREALDMPGIGQVYKLQKVGG